MDAEDTAFERGKVEEDVLAPLEPRGALGGLFRFVGCGGFIGGGRVGWWGWGKDWRAGDGGVWGQKTFGYAFEGLFFDIEEAGFMERVW